jgi:hypothetical protein
MKPIVKNISEFLTEINESRLRRSQRVICWGVLYVLL